jgi:hypothetical protein
MNQTECQQSSDDYHCPCWYGYDEPCCHCGAPAREEGNFSEWTPPSKSVCARCGNQITLVAAGKHYKWVTNPAKADSWHCGNDPLFSVRAHAPASNQLPRIPTRAAAVAAKQARGNREDEVIADPQVDTETCPDHGEQVVRGYSATRGPDPYQVSHLACGHRVICLGPGDPNVIL